MSRIAFNGNALGTGTVTIASPNTNSDRTVTLPDATGTLITNSGTEAISAASLTVSGASTTGSLAVNSNNISAVNSLGFRNRIINGNMVIDQRRSGGGLTPAANGDCLVDRFIFSASQASRFFGGQNYNSVTPPTGFTNYAGVQCSTAQSLASGDFFGVLQRIEGLNTADLAWGSASASAVTLSFRVYSSLTGTFGGSVQNSASNRSYPFSYSVSSANTWTTITVTIPGDTSGTWLTTNGTGIQVFFGLGVGSTYSGTVNSWAGSSLLAPTGAVSVVGTQFATFYVTGVQLEAGSVATPFERRDYGRELMMCQRYYQKSYNTDVAPGANTTTGAKTSRVYNTDAFLPQMETRLLVSMRASPTVTWYTTAGTSGSINVGGGTNTINTQYDTAMNSTGWFYVNGSVASGNQITGHFVASVEL
jgi:hypothetical protein